MNTHLLILPPSPFHSKVAIGMRFKVFIEWLRKPTFDSFALKQCLGQAVIVQKGTDSVSPYCLRKVLFQFALFTALLYQT